MADPGLLLLDEPSCGLAPLVIKEIFEILQEEANREGLSILLVEQNARLALSVSTRCYVLLHGRIFCSGDSRQLSQDESVKKAYLGIAE